MSKSPDAFRTISEVAEWLEKPAHVLRFWESKFPQVKPVKRAGGRRYYRPEDMLLLGGIKKLLHDDGMTIKGAQKIVREQGVRYVSGLSQPLDDLARAALEATVTNARVDQTDLLDEPYALDVEPAEETATVIAFDPVRPAAPDRAAPPAPPAAAPPPAVAPVESPVGQAGEPPAATTAAADGAPPAPAPVAVSDNADAQATPAEGPPAAPVPAVAAATEPAANASPPVADAPDDIARAPLPSFMRAPTPRPPSVPPVARPRIVDVPPLPDPSQVVAAPGLVSMILSRQGGIAPEQRAALLAARDRLAVLRDRMAQRTTD